MQSAWHNPPYVIMGGGSAGSLGAERWRGTIGGVDGLGWALLNKFTPSVPRLSARLFVPLRVIGVPRSSPGSLASRNQPSSLHGLRRMPNFERHDALFRSSAGGRFDAFGDPHSFRYFHVLIVSFTLTIGLMDAQYFRL